jgi:hypothetical protein
MAASYRIIPSLRLKSVRISGSTTYEELEALFFRYVRDPAFRPDLRLLVDLRDMTDAVAGLWEISKLKRLYQYAYCDAEGVVDVVIVTGNTIAFRAAQAFAVLMRDRRPMRVQVVRTWDAALAQLQLRPADLAEADTATVVPFAAVRTPQG